MIYDTRRIVEIVVRNFCRLQFGKNSLLCDTQMEIKDRLSFRNTIKLRGYLYWVQDRSFLTAVVIIRVGQGSLQGDIRAIG